MSDDPTPVGETKAQRKARKAEWKTAVREAKVDLYDQTRWRVQGGRWDFGVERLFFVAGFVLAVIGILITLALTHARWSVDDIVLVPAFAATAGWAIGRWFGSRTHPTDHIASACRSIVIWLVFAAIAWRLALWFLPDGTALGSAERWWLVPAIAGLVFVVGARLRLRGWVTFFAAFIFAIAPLSDDHVRIQDRLVAESSAIQLASAQQSGHTVLMRSLEADTDGRVRVPTKSYLGTVAAATSCGHRSGLDQRHTLLGLRSRVIAFRAEVCWDKDGKPISAELDANSAAQHQLGAFRPIRLIALDPMVDTIGEPLGSIPYAYEDKAKTPLPPSLRTTASGDAAFSPNGQPAGYAETTNGQIASSDGNDTNEPPLDTMLLHVSRDGKTVTMLYAVESRDPLVRHPQLALGNGSTGEDETDSSSPDRRFSLRTRNGYVDDVLTVTAKYEAGSPYVEASILRATAHSSNPNASRFFTGGS